MALSNMQKLVLTALGVGLVVGLVVGAIGGMLGLPGVIRGALTGMLTVVVLAWLNRRMREGRGLS